MELNKKSWHAKLYDYSYTSSLPDNLCSYFWKVILAMILFPLSLPVGLFIKGYTNLLEKIFFNLISLLALLFIFFVFIYAPIMGEFIPMIILLSTISLGLLIGGLVSYLFNRESKPKKPKQLNIFIEYIKATKENYCPKITWKND